MFRGYRLGDFDLPSALDEWHRQWRINRRHEVERQAAFSRDMERVKALPSTFDGTLDEILTLPMTLHPKGLE